MLKTLHKITTKYTFSKGNHYEQCTNMPLKIISYMEGGRGKQNPQQKIGRLNKTVKNSNFQLTMV